MDPRRVLVVTDVELSGWALRQALTARGFVVLTAGDAEAARAVIEVSEPFDALVVSLSLSPERVSKLLEFAEWLWPGVPAILLSADPEPPPVKARAEDVVLEKPFSVESVVAATRRLCGDPVAEFAAGGREGGRDSEVARDHDRDS